MGKDTQIPERSRRLVRVRQNNQCARCSTGNPSEWHHRRSRSVRDTHRHCPCNGVLLCKSCHDWVHAHPFEARALGLIVSRHVAEPGSVPVSAPFTPRTILLACDGEMEWSNEEEEAT
jgi:hypothetical protein